MSADEGRDAAADLGLDLVEVAPNVRPPVCKLMDYGRFRYEQAKKKKEHQSSRPQLKTVQLRPRTDDHDLNTKLRRAQKFLHQGNPVRLVMRLRGRERAVVHRWKELMREYIDRLDEAQPKGPLAAEGRTITVTLESTA